MPSIDEGQVRHIAKLARLKLDDRQIHLFAEQLAKILDHVKQLEAADTADVEPLAHPLPVTNVLRDDEPRPCFDTETALANAPQREGPFFRVPAVLDQAAGA